MKVGMQRYRVFLWGVVVVKEKQERKCDIREGVKIEIFHFYCFITALLSTKSSHLSRQAKMMVVSASLQLATSERTYTPLELKERF